ncbi:MAG: anaerobic sulfatase maturase [Acidimicrobiales bacterium]|nr:anaerobic sulfatase maturase [Acidimicrobiales bacterium]
MTDSNGSLLVMAKPIGSTCNLKCRYCYYLDKKSLFPNRKHFKMTDSVLENLIKNMVESNMGTTLHFVWHGGEPTLMGIPFYEEVVRLQHKLVPNDWKVINSLQTNGTLLNKEWAKFLASEKFEVGLSIDGNFRLHDQIRVDKAGRSTHRRVIGGLNHLREEGIDPDILCTLTSNSTGHPIEIYEYFLDQKVRWLQFLPVVIIRDDNSVDPISVQGPSYGAFLNKIFDRWVRRDLEKIEIQTFVESLLAFSGNGNSLCIHSPTCGNALVVEHEGSVFSCDHYVEPEYHLGNIDAIPIREMLMSDFQVDFGKDKAVNLSTQCQGCKYLFACNGGCPKHRIKNSDNSAQNILCEGYFAYFDHAAPYLKRMVELARTRGSLKYIMEEIKISEILKTGENKIGRNDPCPCGSQKLYKKCCMTL